MDPVPYEIREDDIDEVLNAYESTGGGDLPEERRQEARAHVMRNVLDLNEAIGSAPEDQRRSSRRRETALTDHPGDQSPERREMALAAIEDLLIRDGFITIDAGESRTFPVTTVKDTERND